MHNVMKTFGMALLLIALLSAAGCNNDDDDWGQVGVVTLLDLGDGCWVIWVEDSSVDHGYRYFEPDNLPDAFRVNGLWVRFDYVLPEEWASLCMVGEGIILTRIEEL